MNRKKSFPILIILVFVLATWLGIPAFNKWGADRRVDELCAKDGGIIVYETVTLPRDRFNQWGQFHVADKRFVANSDHYYSSSKTEDIVGKSNMEDIWSLNISRYHISFHRKNDGKLLGEATAYSRRGGDKLGTLMPSAHVCPENISNELSKQIFFPSIP